MNDYKKFVEREFARLDYLKEKETTLEKRKKIMDLLLPENKEKLDKLIMMLRSSLREIGISLHIGKSRESLEKFVEELCDELVPPP